MPRAAAGDEPPRCPPPIVPDFNRSYFAQVKKADAWRQGAKGNRVAFFSFFFSAPSGPQGERGRGGPMPSGAAVWNRRALERASAVFFIRFATKGALMRAIQSELRATLSPAGAPPALALRLSDPVCI